MLKWLKNIFSPSNASTQKIIELEELIAEGWVNGRIMNETAALRASAVFACVRLISGALATAPCRVYQGSRFKKGREEADAHRLAPVLLRKPNPIVTAATFWKSMTADKLLHGNAYAPILRNPAGIAIGLARVKPDRVAVYQAWELGLDKKVGLDKFRLFYCITFDDGTQTTIDQSDMLHIPNLGWDGKQGVSTLRAASDALAGGLDAQEHATRFFKQGASFDYAISYPNPIDETEKTALKKHLTKTHGGVKNSHIPLILTSGAKIEPYSFNPKDSQLLEAREFSVIDICRYFGVPPVMIGETTKTTSWGSGVEQMARWFTTFTLNDHFTAFEQELENKLFWGGGFFPEFDETELIRGDTKTQYEAFKIARGSMQEPGILTINEIRQALGYPTMDGGNELIRPAESGGNTDEGQAEGAV